MAKIDTPNARRSLVTRTEPHWHKLRRGGYIGYRKSKDAGSWICRWRDSHGKQHYKSLGELKDYQPDEQFDHASKIANEWFTDHSNATPTRYTVQNAADDYLKHVKINNGADSEQRTRWQLNKHILPELKELLLEDLTTRRIKSWRDSLVSDGDDSEIVRKSKDSANRNLSILKAMLNLAWRNEHIVNDSAWRKVETFKSVGASRKVYLNDGQIKRLYEASPEPFCNLVKALLLTGMRPGKEPVLLLVEHFDQKQGTLELNDTKTGSRIAYLSDEAIKFFKDMTKDKTPKAPLLPGFDGQKWKLKEPEKLMPEIVKKAKLPKETVLYSLRHTYISRAINAGIPLQVIAENCGTSVRMIEQHYAKFIQEYRKEMMNRVQMI